MDQFETEMYFEFTRRRIAAVERVAARRLAMTREEKALWKGLKALEKNPGLRELVITLILACGNGRDTPDAPGTAG